MTAKKKPASKRAPKGAKKKAVRPELAIVEDILNIMNDADLAEFRYERKGLAISLRKNEGGRVAAAPAAPAAPQAAPKPAAAEKPAAEKETASNLTPITAPMVGTFYRAPAPDADPFVETGNEVKPDTVVCIVEAMKLMNEIKAELSGRIVKICVENGQPVEYGQELFLVEKI